MQKLMEEGKTMVEITHTLAFSRHVSSDVIFFKKGLSKKRGCQTVFNDPKSERLQQFLSSWLK